MEPSNSNAHPENLPAPTQSNEHGQRNRQSTQQQSSNGSLVQTYEPATAEDINLLNSNINFRKNNQRQRHQRKLRAAIRAQEQQSSNSPFPKYFLIKFPGLDLDSSIDVLGVDSDLKKAIGIPEEIKKHSNNTLSIKVKSLKQGDSLRAINKLAAYEVDITENKQMNQSRGTVYSEAMSNSTIERLLEALANQNVVHIERMKTRINKELKDSHRYIITFDQPEIPRTISLTNWHHELIELYVPKPMRCVRCQRLGHTQKRCRAEQALCSQCGDGGHQFRECTAQPRCINCGGDHKSSSNKCPSFIFKSEVLATQAKRKCTFREAEEQAKETYREEGKQYSFAVKRRLPAPSRSLPTMSKESSQQNKEHTTSHNLNSNRENAETEPNSIMTLNVTAEVHEGTHTHSDANRNNMVDESASTGMDESAVAEVVGASSAKVNEAKNAAEIPVEAAVSPEEEIAEPEESTDDGFITPKSNAWKKNKSKKNKNEQSMPLDTVANMNDKKLKSNVQQASKQSAEKRGPIKYKQLAKNVLEKIREENKITVETSGSTPPGTSAIELNYNKNPATKKRDRELGESPPSSKKPPHVSMSNPIPVIDKSRYKRSDNSAPQWK